MGVALLVSQDFCLSHLCSARPLDHQIISGQSPANKPVSHISSDTQHTTHQMFIADCEVQILPYINALTKKVESQN